MGEGLEDRIYFPDDTPGIDVGADRGTIRRLEQEISYGLGDSIVLTRDSAKRIYQIITDQCDKIDAMDTEFTKIDKDNNELSEELEGSLKNIEESINAIIDLIPGEIEFERIENYNKDRYMRITEKIKEIREITERLLEIHKNTSEPI